MAGWRYMAAKLNGDGTQTWLDHEVPISDVELREDLSGPGGITGNISPEIARLKSRGNPLFVPWSTAIYAECDGRIQGGSILVGLDDSTPELKLDCMGFPGYPKGIPYVSDIIKVQVDPLDMARHIWEHVQAEAGGNLGVTVDATKSPIRIGDGPDAAAFGTNMGPYRLAWFQTHDLGTEFDKLAADTPFEYRMQHDWDGEDVAHHLVLGYPTIGRRRSDLRFVVGENISLTPQIDYDGDAYASEAIVLGAGEGRDMVRGGSPTRATRLRRPVVITDKSLRNKRDADARAGRELAMRLGDADLTEITVRDHKHAKYGSYQVGDQILIETTAGWSDGLALWCRIISSKFKPQTGMATLTVVRSDKVA